ncbi:MAG: hypothetical protein IPG64_27065 [Haliea sp.]|nr:hypothetical protein [Haliea sp.]
MKVLAISMHEDRPAVAQNKYGQFAFPSIAGPRYRASVVRRRYVSSSSRLSRRLAIPLTKFKENFMSKGQDSKKRLKRNLKKTMKEKHLKLKKGKKAKENSC